MAVRTASVLLLIGVLAVVVIGVWKLNQPLPRISEPPIDEALDRSTDERAAWESDVFRKIDEPPINEVSSRATEVYRMTLLRAFDGPIVISVTRTSDSLQLRTKLLDGKNGFDPDEMGKISLNGTRELKPEELERLRMLLNDALFWEIPSVDPDDEPITDGAYWILEGRLEGSARSVRRITPKQSLCEVFNYMLGLSRIEQSYKAYPC